MQVQKVDNLVENNRTRVLIWLSSIEREGIDKLVEFLKGSDFFIAPASARYHGNYIGGLCEHSLNVMQLFYEENAMWERPISDESVVICGLLHDACKINYYESTPKGYKVKNKNLIGHGKRSIEVIERYIKLTAYEKEIILYHMSLFNAFDHEKEYEAYDMLKAMRKNPHIQLFASCDNSESHRAKNLN